MNMIAIRADKRLKTAAIAVIAAGMTSVALASGGDGAFIDGLLSFLTGALTGSVGKVIGVAGILYGLVAGIKNGSLAGFGVGVGLAVGAYYGPDIIEAMAPATLVLGAV